MTLINKSAPSKWLDYLPPIYHDQEFLNAYLCAFEKILTGRNDGLEFPADSLPPNPVDGPQAALSDTNHSSLSVRMQRGAQSRSLEETIDLISVLFDPLHTPKEFLPWLAGWAALSLRADLDEGAQRGFIAGIIQLYRRRGTKENLINLLKIFTQAPPEIEENIVPGDDFKKQFPQFANTPQPLYFFRVSILLSDPDPQTVQRKTAIAHALIEMEKPAHTFYELVTTFASMRIGDYTDIGKYRATLGVDTLINKWNKSIDDELKKEKSDAGTKAS